jgi:hypothetical protein
VKHVQQTYHKKGKMKATRRFVAIKDPLWIALKHVAVERPKGTVASVLNEAIEHYLISIGELKAPKKA